MWQTHSAKPNSFLDPSSASVPPSQEPEYIGLTDQPDEAEDVNYNLIDTGPTAAPVKVEGKVARRVFSSGVDTGDRVAAAGDETVVVIT